MSLIQVKGLWSKSLYKEFKEPYFIALEKRLRVMYREKTIYPEMPKILRAFNLTPLDKVKAVIIGQDPYHGKGQANGLCFSVDQKSKLPPSLRNIFSELSSDLNIPKPKSGDLSPWAHQGVLLLNSVLTVEKSLPNSHQGLGWEIFTNRVLELLSNSKENIVYMLWGKYAISKSSLINSKKNLVLTSSHPSPLSAYRGFFGCRHFSKANNYLMRKKINEIDWRIN